MSKYNEVMGKIDEVIGAANAELAKVTERNFPFTFDEVKMSAESDLAGIYVLSGSTPVVCVARTGDADRVVEDIRKSVEDMVERTKTAVERRGSLKEEAAELEKSGADMEKAKEALRAAGLDDSLVGKSFDAKAAEAVVAAARKAVRKANTGLRLRFSGAVDALGGLKNAKLTVKGLPGGVVIMAGDKPALVSRFPKVSNGKAIERMTAFIASDVEAMNESRCRYFRHVQAEADRQEALRALSRRIEDADAALAAFAG